MENLNYEESKDRLESILKKLEEEELSLEEYLNNFNMAMALYKQCNDKLTNIEKELEVIVEKNIKSNDGLGLE